MNTPSEPLSAAADVTCAATPQAWRQLRVPALSYAFLGLILVIDQLLLPMAHIGSFPYKVSYFLCVLWLANFLVTRGYATEQGRDFLRMSGALAVILGCGLLGELLLSAWFTTEPAGAVFRAVSIYVLSGLAFGLGLYARGFRFQWLIWVLAAALLLNFGFIFLKASMPPWLIDLYYSELAVSAFAADLAGNHIQDVRDVLELARPRGLFANPNGSAFMVNIIVLFVHLGLRHRLLRAPPPLLAWLLILVPIGLAVILASRGELIVATVLGVLNYRQIFRRTTPARKMRLVAYAALTPIVASIGLLQVVDDDSLRESAERAMSVFEIVSKLSDSSDQERSVDSIARPLYALERASRRFVVSPLFGSGFSATAGPPFDHGTERFHNDWFHLVVTSGLIGLVAMLWIVRRYCLPLGWPALIPFVLPGLVNTFMLNVAALMFYFFMIGVMREQLRPIDRADA